MYTVQVGNIESGNKDGKAYQFQTVGVYRDGMPEGNTRSYVRDGKSLPPGTWGLDANKAMYWSRKNGNLAIGINADCLVKIETAARKTA